nr:integrase, catalytic region, zinc finger, CCHC-type, peptidase aspartic, catalytic [Tanacetum cinerariifolium]
ATPSPQHELSSSSLPPVTTATIPTVIPIDIPQLRQYTRRARIAQSSALPTAADEPASPIGDDSQSGENLDKIKKKGDACIFLGYSTQSRAYKVFNKRTRVIVETIHVNFDELPQMASDHVSSDLGPECQRTALEHDSLSPGPQCQDNVTQAAEIVVSKSFDVTTTDALNQRQQQHTTPLNNHLTLDPTCQVPTQAPIITSNGNNPQAEMIAENAHVEDDEFINIFCTPVQDRWETLSRQVDSPNMHTFYQHHPSEHHWTKDHPLEQVIGNPSQSVRTRR